MKTLYLDNYKGFSNSFIPFTDVNFFVGENSTGKTAILNLLNILSQPNFWISPDFNNESVELGYFNEIVNQYSENQSYFTIGIEGKEKKNKGSRKYLWLKFKKKNSLPYLSEYMSIIDDKTVYVTLHTSSIEYQLKDFEGECFSEWICRSSGFHSPKKKLRKPVKTMPLALMRGMVMSDFKGELENSQRQGIVLDSIFTNNFLWIAPIRAKAQRTYDAFKQSFSPEGDHIPNVLRNLMSSKGKEKNAAIVDILKHFGQESGLFDDIEIDEYGKIKGAPYGINVLYSNLPVKITNVGYGVSQVMPLIVEIITSKGDTFSIQQPEVHLHPKAQAAFGEFIYHSAVKSHNKFLIETHSDYTINRFRYKLNQSDEKNKIKGQVLFFERTEHGTKVTPLEFNELGQYPENVPDSYGNFFIDEELKMLEI